MTKALGTFLLLIALHMPFFAWAQVQSSNDKKSMTSPAKPKKVKPEKTTQATQTDAQTAKEQNPSVEAEKVKRAKILRNADEYYIAKEYFKAISLYKKGFSKAKLRADKAEIAFRLGECYRWIHRYKESNAQYMRAAKMGHKEPLMHLAMADMYKAQGLYDEALLSYQDFSKEMPEDPRGLAGVQSCKDALDWKNQLTRYQVGNLASINTKSHEFGLGYGGKTGTYDELMFTSMREGGLSKRQDGWTGEFFSDLYTTTKQSPTNAPKPKKGKPAAADPLAARDQVFSLPVLMMEPINTEDHEGSAAFDSRRRTLYFTRCMDVKRAQLGCAIYEAKRMGAVWAEPTPIILTPDSSKSVGHPSVSSDDQLLYFAGDLDGAIGGKDLWVSKFDKRKKKWGHPINLGKLINTDGDELYPFVHDDGYLYFSSNGLPGMGGLDLFRVELGADGLPIGEPQNLKSRINSQNDDFNLVLRPGGLQEGYFVSNREGGKGGDDIWSFYEIPLTYTLRGSVVSSKTGRPIAQANVKIVGSDGFVHSVVTSKEGVFTVESDKLSGEVTYTFSLDKKKFLNTSSAVNSLALTLDKFVFQDDKNVYLHTLVFAGKMDPIEVPIVLPNIFFDLAKWDLRPESQSAMDSVYKILLTNPNIAIELRSHTDFRGTGEDNDVLSLNRAQSCVDYLISKGIPADRLTAVGMGEREPFSISEGYKGEGSTDFASGAVLNERYIKTLTAALQEVAHQVNRRTDFKVTRDDYAPAYDPSQEVDAATVAAEAAVAIAAAKPPKGEFYTVTDKDNFTTICKATGLTLVELKKFNGGLRGVRVFPGMQLKITRNGDYVEFDANHRRVEFDETWGAIAKSLDLKEKELKNLNPEIDDELLPGTYIRTK